MTQELIQTNNTIALAERVEAALIGGDLSKLTVQERGNLYQSTCQSLGLNPLTNPFKYLSLNNKLVLYATKDCTDQLRGIHAVSVEIKAREAVDDLYVVTARGWKPDGRVDESIGAVSFAGLKGEAKANAMMKAETKARRRLTLSLCGLGMIDGSEVESIPGAREVADTVVMDQPKQIEQKVPAVLLQHFSDLPNSTAALLQMLKTRMDSLNLGTDYRRILVSSGVKLPNGSAAPGAGVVQVRSAALEMWALCETKHAEEAVGKEDWVPDFTEEVPA